MSSSSTFAALRNDAIAKQMGVVLPEQYKPAKVVQGRVQTCRLLDIGIAYVPSRSVESFTRSEEEVQAALLEPRTARPLPLFQRLAGAVWKWL